MYIHIYIYIYLFFLFGVSVLHLHIFIGYAAVFDPEVFGAKPNLIYVFCNLSFDFTIHIY